MTDKELQEILKEKLKRETVLINKFKIFYLTLRIQVDNRKRL